MPSLDWQASHLQPFNFCVIYPRNKLGQWPHLQSDPSTLCSGSESCQSWKKKNLILGILDYVNVKSWSFFQTIDILFRLDESRITTLHILLLHSQLNEWIQPEMSKIKWLTNGENGQPANWRKKRFFKRAFPVVLQTVLIKHTCLNHNGCF